MHIPPRSMCRLRSSLEVDSAADSGQPNFVAESLDVWAERNLHGNLASCKRYLTPTGTVTFMDGTAALGTATLEQRFSLLYNVHVGGGSHSMTAAYSRRCQFSWQHIGDPGPSCKSDSADNHVHHGASIQSGLWHQLYGSRHRWREREPGSVQYERPQWRPHTLAATAPAAASR